MIGVEISAWNMIYQRKDQDFVGMEIFHEAEEELTKKSVAPPLLIVYPL
jgi:hypothetical protein